MKESINSTLLHFIESCADRDFKIFPFNMNTMLRIYVLIKECKIQTFCGQNIDRFRCSSTFLKVKDILDYLTVSLLFLCYLCDRPLVSRVHLN